jgi:transposase-like protein
MKNTKTDKIGRQLNQFSTEEWIELVREYQKSGLTLKQFAENKNVNRNTFSYWVYKSQRQKRKAKTARKESSAFVEVSIPVKEEPIIEIQLPNGIRVNLNSVSKDDISFVIKEVLACLD